MDEKITIGCTMIDSNTKQVVKVLDLREETDQEGNVQKMVKVDYNPGVSWVSADRMKSMLFG